MDLFSSSLSLELLESVALLSIYRVGLKNLLGRGNIVIIEISRCLKQVPRSSYV